MSGPPRPAKKPGAKPEVGDLFDPPPAARAYAAALAEAGERKARKPAPFKLTAERGRERPEQRAMVQLLNMKLVNGFCFHVVNEGFWSIFDKAIPDRNQRMKLIGQLKQAMLKDGFVPRMPDNPLFWRFPDEWRACLVANGFELPERMAMAGMIEAKRPGWTESGDKAWRESRDQQFVFELLRRADVPFAVATNADEAVAAARAMGAPVRDRPQGAGGGVLRSDVADPP